MVSRMLNKSKGRFFFFFILLVVVISVVYLYLVFIQENFKNIQWSEKRCLSELTSVKSQLNVVTDYKNRIDKMLSDSQKAHEADKDKFKDVMESFKAMKQQSAICQSQFDDLQGECKKVREYYNQENKEVNQLKEQYKELLNNNEHLQNSMKDQYNYIDTLRSENARLHESLRAQQIPNNFEAGVRHYNNKTFSHQVEESDGVYKIDFKNHITEGQLNNFQKEPVDKSSQLLQLHSMKVGNKEKSNEIVPNRLPPGFAPVLPVLENENSNIPKPLDIPEKSDESNKQENMLKEETNENRVDLMHVQDVKDVNVFDNNINVHDIDSNDVNKAVDGKDVLQQNHVAEEDDDDGDEYPA